MPETELSPNPATKGSGNTSLARKLMLAALVIHLFSLFLPYRDSQNEGSPVYLEKWHVIGIQGVSKELTGFEEKPYAIYVIIGLLVMFGSDLYEEPIWRRYIYWISFVLLICFAFGGAPFRTSGGKLAMFCLAIVLIAAYLDRKEIKRRNVSSI
jgi:uncharacterized membrane protein YoaK (UPF0700 family)